MKRAELEQRFTSTLLMDKNAIDKIDGFHPKYIENPFLHQVNLAVWDLIKTGKDHSINEVYLYFDKKNWDKVKLSTLITDYLPWSDTLQPLFDEIRENYHRKQIFHVYQALSKQTGFHPAANRNIKPLDYLLNTTKKYIESIELNSNQCQKSTYVKDILKETWEIINELRESRKNKKFLETGLYSLDKIIGGFLKSDKIIIAGLPSSGKTALLLAFILNACFEHKGLFFSLESPKHSINMRLISNITSINLFQITRGYLNDIQLAQVREAMNILSKLQLCIHDEPVNIDQIKMISKREKRLNDIEFIAIDNFSKIPYPGKGSREEELTKVSNELSALSNDLNIPTIILSHITEGQKGKDKEPTLLQLKYTGALAQDADIVIFAHRLQDQTGKLSDQLKLLITKNRDGITGSCKVQFIRKYQQFISKNPEEEVPF